MDCAASEIGKCVYIFLWRFIFSFFLKASHGVLLQNKITCCDTAWEAKDNAPEMGNKTAMKCAIPIKIVCIHCDDIAVDLHTNTHTCGPNVPGQVHKELSSFLFPFFFHFSAKELPVLMSPTRELIESSPHNHSNKKDSLIM